MNITHVTRTTQMRKGEIIAEWWSADMPDGRMFLIDGSMTEEQAQSEYEAALRQESITVPEHIESYDQRNGKIADRKYRK